MPFNNLHGEQYNRGQLMARTPERRAARGRRFQYYQSGNASDSLTASNIETLSHITYNLSTGRLATDVPFEVTLDSLYFGGAWRMSSGAYSLYFSSLLYNSHSTPVMSSILDPSIVANQNSSGVINATARIVDPDSFAITEFNGAARAGTSTGYSGITTLPFNSTGYGIQTIVEQHIHSTDVLHYVIYNGTDTTGTPMYEQHLTGFELDEGEELIWWFDHPVDFIKGAVVYAEVMLHHDHTVATLQVRKGTSDPERYYSKVPTRTFIDKVVTTQDEVATDIGQTEWIFGDATLSNSIHWYDGQILAWPAQGKGVSEQGEYISWNIGGV